MDDTKDDTKDGRCALASRLQAQLRGSLGAALRDYARAVAAERVCEYRGQPRELDQILAVLRLRRAWPALEYVAAAARAESADWTYAALHDESVACERLIGSLRLQDPDACCAAWDARGCPALQLCPRGIAALQSLQRRAELAIADAEERAWEGVNA